MNRRDFQQLALARLAEAECLINNGHYSGAYYLCGYAVECALKAGIAKLTRLHDFPDKKRTLDSYTHDLNTLLIAADLKAALDKEAARDKAFRDYWLTVKAWSEQSRYQTSSESEARNLYQAVTDSKHGVLRWIRKEW